MAKSLLGMLRYPESTTTSQSSVKQNKSHNTMATQDHIVTQTSSTSSTGTKTKSPYEIFKDTALKQLEEQHQVQLQQLKALQVSQREELIRMLNSTTAGGFNLLTPLSQPCTQPAMQPASNSQPKDVLNSGAGSSSGSNHLQPPLAPNLLEESSLAKIPGTNPPQPDSSAYNHKAFASLPANAFAGLEGSEKDRNFDFSWAKKVLEGLNFKMNEKSVECIFNEEEEQVSDSKGQYSDSPVTSPSSKKQKMSSDNSPGESSTGDCKHIFIPKCFENSNFNILERESASSVLLKTAQDLCTNSAYNFLVVKKSFGVTISFCPCKDSRMKLSKVHFTVEGVSPSVVANFIMSRDRENELKHEVLQRSKNFRTIRRVLEMGSFFVMKREIVAYETWKNIGNGCYLVAGQSVNIPSLPENKEVVKAICDIGAYLVAPCHNGTAVTFVTRTDLSGLLPASLVNILFGVHMNYMKRVWEKKLAQKDAFEDYFGATTQTQSYPPMS